MTMPDSNVVYVQAEVKFTNRKAARAIMRIAELAEEIADDQPWNDAAREMLKAAKYVARNVVVEIKRDDAPKLFSDEDKS